MSIVIQAENVSKRFYLRHNRTTDFKVRVLAMFDPRQRETVEEFWALRDVSLAVREGEAVGLVGRNGSGKSTFLKIIADLHRPTTGRLRIAANARIGAMIELGVGFHPELSGRENVVLNASVYGLTRREIAELYPKVVAYSGLEPFMDTALKNYSSGMHMRLGFAVAANMSPDILLLDEIFAVGDVEFQRQCFATLRGFRDAGKTIVFVSHDPDAVRTLCDRVCVLEHGRVMFDGGVNEGLEFYRHMTAAPEPARS